MAQADSKKLVENLNAERVEKLGRGADTLQMIGGCLTIFGFMAIVAAFCTLIYMTVEGKVIMSAATTAWTSASPMQNMAIVLPHSSGGGDLWHFEIMECSFENGNFSTWKCVDRTADSEECSVSTQFSQPNMAGVEASGHTHCLPGTGNEAAALQIQGSFGDEMYQYALIKLRPTNSSANKAGWLSLLYESKLADNTWQSMLFTFSPLLQQTREIMLQKHTTIRYGVDGMPPGVSLDPRSEEADGLEYSGGYLRLGELDEDDPVPMEFILRAHDIEVTKNYRYFMTVPGIITTMGGTLTAVLYVVLGPLAVYCLWKKCRGESLLEGVAEQNLHNDDHEARVHKVLKSSAIDAAAGAASEDAGNQYKTEQGKLDDLFS